jgi:hypothetical protein
MSKLNIINWIILGTLTFTLLVAIVNFRICSVELARSFT